MTEISKVDCDYCKEKEKNKIFLEKNVSQRREIVLISKFIRVKRNENSVLEKTIYTPKYFFVNGKDSLSERVFQVVIGNKNTLNIPYGAIKEIWEDVSGKIELELRLTIVLDEDAREGEKLRLEQTL